MDKNQSEMKKHNMAWKTRKIMMVIKGSDLGVCCVFSFIWLHVENHKFNDFLLKVDEWFYAAQVIYTRRDELTQHTRCQAQGVGTTTQPSPCSCFNVLSLFYFLPWYLPLSCVVSSFSHGFAFIWCPPHTVEAEDEERRGTRTCYRAGEEFNFYLQQEQARIVVVITTNIIQLSLRYSNVVTTKQRRPIASSFLFVVVVIVILVAVVISCLTL